MTNLFQWCTKMQRTFGRPTHATEPSETSLPLQNIYFVQSAQFTSNISECTSKSTTKTMWKGNIHFFCLMSSMFYSSKYYFSARSFTVLKKLTSKTGAGKSRRNGNRGWIFCFPPSETLLLSRRYDMYIHRQTQRSWSIFLYMCAFAETQWKDTH